MTPIEKYVELLQKISRGPHPLEEFARSNTLGTQESEQAILMLRRLSEDGLVHIEDNKINSSNKITITPKGSLALLEWTHKIEEKSVLHKLKGAVVNFLWLAVGASLTYIVQINS